MTRLRSALLALALALAGVLVATSYPVTLPEPPRPIFIGDSLTEQLPVRTVIPNAMNYGVGGITIEGLRERVPDYPLAGAPLVVMTIGTGNIREQNTGPEIEAGLRDILAHIDGPLLWNAVPPTDRGDREVVNRVERRLCAERPNCRFLESPAFVPSDFKDGTHMTDAGKARWAAHMRAALGRS